MAPPKFNQLLKAVIFAISSGRSHYLSQVIDRCLDQASRVDSISTPFSEQDLTRAHQINHDGLERTLTALCPAQSTSLDKDSLKMFQDAFSSTAVKAAICRPLYLLPEDVLPSPPKSHLFSAEHSKIVEAAWLKFLLLLDRLYSQEASTTLYRILLPLVHIAILYIQGEQHFERPSQPQQAKQNKKTQSTKPAVTHQHVRDAHKRKILKDMISSKKGNRKRYSA